MDAFRDISTRDISTYYTQLRKRVLYLHILRATGIALGVNALLLLAMLHVAPRTESWSLMRTLSWILGIATCVIVGIYYFKAIRPRTQLPYLTRLLSAHNTALASDLRSVIELTNLDENSNRRTPHTTPQETHYTEPLLNALAQHTLQTSSAYTPNLVVPIALLKPALLFLVAGGFIWSFNFLFHREALVRALHGMFVMPPTPSITISPTPLTGDLSVTYVYPKHMRRSVHTIRSTTGTLTAPLGTVVTLEAIPTGKFHAIWISLDAPERQAEEQAIAHRPSTSSPRRKIHFSVHENRMKASFALAYAGSYTIEAASLHGTVRDPIERQIVIEPDLEPRVTLFAPPDGIAVTAEQSIELGYAITDDYGLNEIRLAFQGNSQATPNYKLLWRDKTLAKSIPKKEAIDRFEWTIDESLFGSNTEVSFWIEALDNDTASGPKRGASTKSRLSLIDPEADHAHTIEEQEQLLEAMLPLLSERLLLFDDATLPNADSSSFTNAHRAYRAFSDRIQAFATEFSRDPLALKSTVTWFNSFAREHLKLIRAEASLASALKQHSNSAQLKHHNEKIIEALERDTLRLAALLDETRLASLLEITQSLKASRERIAELFKRYKETQDETLRKQMMEEIARMERRMNQLWQKMAALRSTIPDEFLNAEALQQVKLNDALRDLSTIAKEGTLDELESAIGALDDRLNHMNQLLETNLGEYRQEHLAEDAKAYAKLLDDLKRFESTQRALAEKTEALQQRYQQQAQQRLSEHLKPRLDRERNKAKQLREALDRISRERLADYLVQPLHNLKTWAESLDDALTQTDIPQAREWADAVESSAGSLLEDIVDNLIAPLPTDKLRKGDPANELSQAHQLAGEIRATLDELGVSPRTLLSPKELNSLAQLAERQAALKKSIEDYAEHAGRDREMQSFYNDKLEQGLKRTTEQMGSARRGMKQISLGQAHDAQRQAIQSLEAARREVESSRMTQSPQRAQRRSEPVKIPGADAFRPPKAFREELLDAMKEKPPTNFEQEVNRYYRDLVR